MSAKSLPVPVGPIALSMFGQSNMRRLQRQAIMQSLFVEGYEILLQSSGNVHGKGVYETNPLSDSLVLDADVDGLNITRGQKYESQFDDGAGGGRLRRVVDLAKTSPLWPSSGKIPLLHCHMQGEADSDPESYALANPNWLEALMGFIVEDFPEFDVYFCVGLPWFDPDDPFDFVDTIRSGLISKGAELGWGIVDSKDLPRGADPSATHIETPEIYTFADRFASVAKTGNNFLVP